MATKFPTLIHVTEEDLDSSGDPWLLVHRDGVNSIEDPQDVAVYKLVSIGRVDIQKKYVEKKGKKR